LLTPIGIRRHSRKGWQIEFACERCGMRTVNRAAPDDTDAVIALMSR
jgi:RNHCP domain-containing protein